MSQEFQEAISSSRLSTIEKLLQTEKDSNNKLKKSLGSKERQLSELATSNIELIENQKKLKSVVQQLKNE